MAQNEKKKGSLKGRSPMIRRYIHIIIFPLPLKKGKGISPSWKGKGDGVAKYKPKGSRLLNIPKGGYIDYRAR